jgi:hypothetical protein
MPGGSARLRLRCFLEGVEVPIIAIQVMALPNAPLMAALQVPPVAEGTRILPRTLVHAFFLDFYEDESPFVSTERVSTTAPERSPTAYEQALRRRRAEPGQRGDWGTGRDDGTDDLNERYKLLFVGEVVGFEWTKSASRRSLVLQCADLSNYWDYAYQWTNTGIFGPGLKALFAGGSTNLFTDFLSSNAEVLTNLLRTRSITFPKLGGLAGGIIRLIEAIGGSFHHERKITGQNVFFTLAELRLHITQMIAAVEDDPTASRLLGVQGYGGLFSRLLGGLGGQTSIRKSINALSGIIFHEMYAQPCPLYEPGTEGTVTGRVRRKLSDDPALAFVPSVAERVKTSLERLKVELAELDAPSDRQGAGALRQALAARLEHAGRHLSGAISRLGQLGAPGPRGLLTAARERIHKARALVRTRFSPGDVASTARILVELDRAIDALGRTARLTVVVTPKKSARPARLNQQIFRPDVWFSAPPRSNVLFPEQYESLQYRRQFLEEPTRLLLKTNDEFFGEDELFDRYYFAPKSRSLSQDKTKLQRLLQNDLLEHEILTGILPVFEKMGELNIFAARGGVTRGRGGEVGLAQRSANFVYFKYRFAARQMQVRARFNPYVAVGFPGLIIDKYVDQGTLELYQELLQKEGRPTRDITKLLGTHFLANFTQVTHTVSQDQGATEIVASYPRQPEEGVEFLGATERGEVTVTARFDEDVLRTTDVAALFAPRALSTGPSLGRVVRVTEVTDLYRGPGGSREGALSTKALLLFGGEASRLPRRAEERLKARVPVGFAVDARTLSASVRRELGIGEEGVLQASAARLGERGAAQPVRIRAFRIEEEVPRFRQEQVELPAEEYIRPGWYGDVWHPASIGRAYETFFRTGAITDPHEVSDPGGGRARAAGGAATDALAESLGASGLGDPRIDAPAVFSLREGASVEQAVAFIVATYSRIKQEGFDVDEFIRAYTWRPIASMVDLFGTSDLALSADGSEVVSGIEGFHSRAFGPFSDLFGLVTPEIESVVGIERGSRAALHGDTRKMKQEAVKDFVSALGFARAILG